MRKATMAVAVLTAAVLLSVGFYVTAAPRGISQPARVAVLDFGRLLKECDQIKAADKDFRATQETLAREAEKRIEEVKALRKRLVMHVPGSPAHKQTRDEIEKKAIANDTWYKTKLRGLQQDQQAILQRFYDDVERITGEYAVAHRLSLVLKVDRFSVADRAMEDFGSRMRAKKIVYAANDVDITNDVLALLNNRFRAGRKPK